MTLDNDFVENGWIYLLWSDPVEFKMNLSRFTVGPDDTIDPREREAAAGLHDLARRRPRQLAHGRFPCHGT